jgi:hypothetical protein
MLARHEAYRFSRKLEAWPQAPQRGGVGAVGDAHPPVVSHLPEHHFRFNCGHIDSNIQVDSG